MAPNPFERAADRYDPPPPEPWRASPVELGVMLSGGKWEDAPHLRVIENAVLKCIRESGRLLISVSVRHGKSELIARRLVAWYFANHPDNQVILGTNTIELAEEHGGWIRDTIAENAVMLGINISETSAGKAKWNIAGRGGRFRGIGVGGALTGFGADLAIIDDPYKNRAHAMSPSGRKDVINWYTGTFATRLHPDAAVIIICSRWHEEDLSGFLLNNDADEWTELRMPALCDDPENDPLGRAEGEAIWPSHWPVDKLERQHRAVAMAEGELIWDAQFQQRPNTPSGGAFPEDKWDYLRPFTGSKEDREYAADLLDTVQWCRSWDLAGTEGGGDWTVGVKIGRLPDGRTVIGDVKRGQWASSKVRAELARTARADGAGCKIELPQDPAQAGKDQASQLVAMLAGFDVRAIPQTGSKETRAAGYSAQQQAGNVLLVEGPWNDLFVKEHTSFPTGKHDDQVDAASSGFNRMVGPSFLFGSSQDIYALA